MRGEGTRRERGGETIARRFLHGCSGTSILSLTMLFYVNIMYVVRLFIYMYVRYR